MANGIRIDNLNSATSLNDTDIMTIVQDKENKKMPMSLIDCDGSYSQSVINTIPDLITTSKANVETTKQAIDEKFDYDEFSAQISTVKEMSNIGFNDDGYVDVSSQVQDGFMETAILYGKTLVNNVTTDTSNDDYVAFDKDYSGQNFSISGTVEGSIKSAILKGSTKYRDIDTGEVLDAFEDGRNLELVSVKMPVLTTTGKNLFDKTRATRGYIINANGVLSVSSGNGVTDYIKVESGKTYVRNASGFIAFYDNNKNFIERTSTSSTKFTAVNDGYIRWNVGSYDEVVDTLQVEEGSTSTPYEPYKSNILTTPADLELRGIGDVQDTLDLMTGEVIMKSDVFNDWDNADIVKTGNYGTVSRYDLRINVKPRGKIISNLFNEGTISTSDLECVNIHSSSNLIQTQVLTSKLSEDTISGFREWAKNNNYTLIYELETESIKTVDLTILDNNGHIINNIHTFNETTHINTSSQVLIPEISFSKSVSHDALIKANTQYTIDLKHNDKDITVNVGGNEVIFASGETRKTITTPNTLTNNTLSYYGLGAKTNSIMLLEGNETRDLDYFTGMQSVKYTTHEDGSKMPILHTVGKNLFDGELESGVLSLPSQGLKPNNVTNNNYVRSTNKISVLPNTVYTISSEINSEWYIAFINREGNYASMANKASSSTVFTFTTPSDCYFIRFYKKSTDIKLRVQLEQGSSATTYEPHKSSILSTENDLIMRSNGSTRDSLDLITGKFTQRIDEDGNILATPIETTIDINSNLGDEKLPIVYKEGYILLQSDELTPELKYSIPISYSGLIAQNTMTNLKHSWRLDELELLAYASIVNSQYDSLILVSTAETNNVMVSSDYVPDVSLYNMLKVLVNANALQNADEKISTFYLYGKLSDEMFVDLIIGDDM